MLRVMNVRSLVYVPNARGPRVKVTMFADKVRRILTVPCEINGKKVYLQHDTGAGISQVSLRQAGQFGLHGHPRLFGTSFIGNGNVKQDYLAICALTIEGITTQTILKVRQNNTALLGLDIQSAFDFDLNINSCTASVAADPPGPLGHFAANPADLQQMMEDLKITEADLIPFKDMPEIDPTRELAAQEFLLANGSPQVGSANPVIGVFLGEEDRGRSQLPPPLADIFGLIV